MKKTSSLSAALSQHSTAVVDNAMDAIITIDENEVVTIFNKAAERMFGYPAAKAINQKLNRFIPAPFHGKLSGHIKKFGFSKAKARPMDGLLVIRGRRTNGQEFPLEASISHTEIDGKKLFTVILRDITERVKTEETLRNQSERLLQQNRMLDFAPVLVRDLKNRIVFWNRGAEEMYGFTEKQALGKVSHKLLKTRFPEPSVKIEAGLKKNPEWNGELIHTRADGENLVVASRWVRHFDKSTKSGYFVEVNTDITERKKAEEAAQKFTALVQYSEDAIISKTLEGIITSWNPAAEKMFGYKPREAIGKHITLIFPPDRLAEEALVLNKIRRGELVQHFETERVKKNGKRISVSATISPLKDAKGKIIGASKILRDITEQRNSEQQLRLLGNCIANINDIVIVTEADSTEGEDNRIVFINEALDRVMGYDRKKMIGRSVNVLISKKNDKQVLDEIKEAVKAYKPIRRQLIHEGIDGREFVMDVDISPIFDAEGRCAHFVSIHRDVTEHNRVMHRIEEQAELLDKTQDAILVRDIKGTVLLWNKGAQRMYGYGSEEAVGKFVGDLIYADVDKFREANAEVFKKGDWSGELRHITKNRQELIIEARWSLLRDKNGKPKSVLAVNTDVTEKRKIESQFMRAQRMESIGILAGGIAHDLNNILAPIILSLDMLKASATDPDTQLIVETIDISARRGADIVQQVLSFARGVEGRRIEIQPKYLLKDLEHIIRDTFPKDIRLQLTLADDLWTIQGDPTQVHQILLNLCVNARDAMPKGGTLNVAADNRQLDEQYVAMNIEAKPGPYVVLSVTDSGTGIPPSVLDKIFEPFFTTKEVGKGTGLGLSTVRAIVKSHEGFINVYSESGIGTTFKIYLPALLTTSAEGSENIQEAVLPRGNGETILIIDDEASIITITGQTLRAFGYRVMKAANGAEAIAIYAQHKAEIDVVLTDMAMPVMDGPATIYALLKINPSLKIIAASGLYANGGVAKASSAGIKYFISKPYTAAILLKTIRDILDDPALPKADK